MTDIINFIGINKGQSEALKLEERDYDYLFNSGIPPFTIYIKNYDKNISKIIIEIDFRDGRKFQITKELDEKFTFANFIMRPKRMLRWKLIKETEVITTNTFPENLQDIFSGDFTTKEKLIELLRYLGINIENIERTTPEVINTSAQTEGEVQYA